MKKASLEKNAESIRAIFVTGKKLFFIIGLSLLIAFNAANIYGQEILQPQPSPRPGERPPPIPEVKPIEPPAVFKLPTPPPLKEEEVKQLPLERVFISKIIVTGNTVFSKDEIANITQPYENRWLTSEDLEKLRRDLTLQYIDNGYITSGAFIPDQDVADGTITFNIIEGQIDDISVTNNKWLNDRFIKNRVGLATKKPVNIKPIQERLQLLQQDPRIEKLNAELRPGLKLGESNLNIDIEEKIPLRIWSSYDNYLSRNTGPEQFRIGASFLSLTTNGDILNFMWGKTESSDTIIDTSYSFPITRYDTTLSFRYRINDYELVEDIFRDLEIEQDNDIYTIALRQPVFRNLNHEFALTLIGEKNKTETKLLDEPFSLALGADEGTAEVTALRFEQTYTYRSQRQVIAARSRFSFGLDVWDATNNDDSDIPDAEFFAWLGQFQWAQRLNLLDMQLLFRADAQLTEDPLFALEQIAVGGRYSVRGYNENEFVRDKGVILSLESRIPIVQDKAWADYLQIIPFFDYGWAENEGLLSSITQDEIYSVGVGLRWALTFKPPARLRPMFEVYYGKKLNEVDSNDSNNLQDKGVHFQFTLAAF